MRNRMITGVAVLLAIVFTASAGDAVEPASAAFTNVRNEAVQSISGSFYQGSTLLLSNCVACTTGSVVQGLSGVTVDVAVGNLTTNIEYEATVVSTNLGTWWVSFPIPSLASFFIQVKLTDENTNSYIYPNKTITAQQSLF